MIDYAEGDMAPGLGITTAAVSDGRGDRVDVATHFDPSPLLDTFDKTITFLHGLNEKVSFNVKTLEDEVSSPAKPRIPRFSCSGFLSLFERERERRYLIQQIVWTNMTSWLLAPALTPEFSV